MRRIPVEKRAVEYSCTYALSFGNCSVVFI